MTGSGVYRQLPQDFVCLSLFKTPIDIDGDGGVDFFHQGRTWGEFEVIRSNRSYGPNLDGTAQDDRLIGGSWNNVFDGRW